MSAFTPNSLTIIKEFLQLKTSQPMFWPNISDQKTSATSSEANQYPLKSCKTALIRWELCRLRHPAYKKCYDLKPGKLMSLHFYLLNLYRLLCQGLWGLSVLRPVIVFPLFAWEYGIFFIKIKQSPSIFSSFFSPHGERQGDRENLFWIIDITAVKLNS